MPKAIDFFKGFGMQPVAVPTVYMQKQIAVEQSMVIFPSATNFTFQKESFTYELEHYGAK
jgi:hypothetical protein